MMTRKQPTVQEMMKLATDLWEFFAEREVRGPVMIRACIQMVATYFAQMAKDDAHLNEGIALAVKDLRENIEQAYAKRMEFEADPEGFVKRFSPLIKQMGPRRDH